ncbi:MAG: organomercurial lyase, partial [Chloroflexota bacterium]
NFREGVMDITTAVKMNIYQTIVDQCRAPDVNEVSQSMKLPISGVQQAFESLAEQRLLVLEPADKRRIRMAPPFSGIKTPMQVQVADKTHYANCCWDALGVAAALHQDADIFTSCAYSGQALAIQVRDGRVQPVDCLAHFAVPAALWWQDIVYT